jgi:hypothetical protein
VTKFRKGDVLLLKVTVKHDTNAEDGEITVMQVDGYAPIYAKVADTELVHQFIEIGDRVLWTGRSDEDFGTVLAVANDHAWIDLGGGDYCTRTLSSIYRAKVSDESAS